MRTCRRAWMAVLAIALHGCVINANLNTGYRPYMTPLRPAPVPDSLAVQRFRDARPPRVYSTAGRGFLTYVRYDRPCQVTQYAPLRKRPFHGAPERLSIFRCGPRTFVGYTQRGIPCSARP